MKLKAAIFALMLWGMTVGAIAVEPLPVPVTISLVFCNPNITFNSDYTPSLAAVNTDATANCPVMIVHSNLQFASTVRLSPGAHSTVIFSEFSISLAAGETQYLSLADFKLGVGRQVLHVVANILNADGLLLPAIQPFAYQPLMISDSGLAAAVSFDDAFLGMRKAFVDPSESPGIDSRRRLCRSQPDQRIQFRFPRSAGGHDHPSVHQPGSASHGTTAVGAVEPQPRGQRRRHLRERQRAATVTISVAMMMTTGTKARAKTKARATSAKIIPMPRIRTRSCDWRPLKVDWPH